jgi:hypothetical protein
LSVYIRSEQFSKAAYDCNWSIVFRVRLVTFVLENRYNITI